MVVVEPCDKMSLLSIPEEVIEGSILPYLGWNDLLRFRRVCKGTKVITDGYLKVHPELAPEIEINERDKSFGAFLQIGIPSNRIYLRNSSGEKFYQKDAKKIAEFLEKYGPLVKCLRVKQFSLYAYGKEWDFMESLVNLHTFEADYFGVGKNVTTPQELQSAMKETIVRAKQDPRFVSNVVPNVFKQLKSLKIGQQRGITIGNVTNRTAGFLEKGKGLEYVSLPFNSHFATTSTFTVPDGQTPQHAMARAFVMIDLAIIERAKRFAGKPNLKVFDFRCYHDKVGFETAQMEWTGSQVFLELCLNSLRYDVKLMNVGPFWFHQRANLAQFSLPELGRPVLSLVNLHPCVLPLDMPNLERVEIRATSRSSCGASWRQERPDWPVLKDVDITVDCKQVTCSEWDNGRPGDVFFQDTRILFHFFFQGIRRTNMTEIRLNFTKDADSVAIPKTDDIVAACPNLKKITLIKWPGTNKALLKLWEGLPALEEISLENCKGLGNVAFVGEDPQRPVFFKLRNLKKLSLKGLDKMPKVTDTLFSLVLRRMRLSHLTLTSDNPIKSVTSDGIRALLEGIFSEKVEKFPFKGWSLAGASEYEFKMLENRFRSSQML